MGFSPLPSSAAASTPSAGPHSIPSQSRPGSAYSSFSSSSIAGGAADNSTADDDAAAAAKFWINFGTTGMTTSRDDEEGDDLLRRRRTTPLPKANTEPLSSSLSMLSTDAAAVGDGDVIIPASAPFCLAYLSSPVQLTMTPLSPSPPSSSSFNHRHITSGPQQEDDDVLAEDDWVWCHPSPSIPTSLNRPSATTATTTTSAAPSPTATTTHLSPSSSTSARIITTTNAAADVTVATEMAQVLVESLSIKASHRTPPPPLLLQPVVGEGPLMMKKIGHHYSLLLKTLKKNTVDSSYCSNRLDGQQEEPRHLQLVPSFPVLLLLLQLLVVASSRGQYPSSYLPYYLVILEESERLTAAEEEAVARAEAISQTNNHGLLVVETSKLVRAERGAASTSTDDDGRWSSTDMVSNAVTVEASSSSTSFAHLQQEAQPSSLILHLLSLPVSHQEIEANLQPLSSSSADDDNDVDSNGSSSHADKQEDQVQEGAEEEKIVLLSLRESTLFCPLSNHITTDPVLACDGHSYQREALQDYLDQAEAGERKRRIYPPTYATYLP